MVGEALRAPEESGQADSTLVLFLSDNGMAFPFFKANCYLQSTRTPMIARWPGRIEEGRRVRDSFVSTLDLFSTICEAAGVETPETDGRSLLPLLQDGEEEHRDHVVTVFHETAARRRYEMRCLQDDRFGYIWNGWAGRSEYQAENMMGLTWPAMLAAAEADPALAQRVDFYRNRTGEELYDLAEDPHGLRDLSGDPDHAEVLAGMRARLAAWMEQTGDPCTSDFAQTTPAR